MDELLEHLRQEDQAKAVCEAHGFNMALLKPLFIHLMKGYNNTQVAEHLGIHRVTVQRYVAELRRLKESEFKILQREILGVSIDEGNSD